LSRLYGISIPKSRIRSGSAWSGKFKDFAVSDMNGAIIEARKTNKVDSSPNYGSTFRRPIFKKSTVEAVGLEKEIALLRYGQGRR
jgi:hypothetical protein